MDTDSSEITDKDLRYLAELYNLYVSKYHPFQYRITFCKNYQEKSWYKDLITLYRLCVKLKVDPREYIAAQISEYKRPMKKAKPVPTIKQMLGQTGISRYNIWLVKTGKLSPTINPTKISDFEQYWTNQLNFLLKKHNITEENFFKDLFCINQLSPKYVKSRPIFQRLVKENFYKTKFGVDVQEIFI